jgi:ferredoxin--NADP+ reductase
MSLVNKTRQSPEAIVYPIVQKSVLAPTITKFVIKAPFVARKRLPGNFVIIRVEENGERIPLTIVDSDNTHGTITLIVQSIGKTTKLMATKNANDSLVDVVGPLGNPTPILEGKTVACVGGGVGTAELYPITRALQAAGNTIHTVIGARSKDLVVLENEMTDCSNHIVVTTDDGSYGRKGFVTDALKEILETSPEISAVYAIGPLPMMKAVSHLTKNYNKKTYVSLNAVMVDGTGMCGGCRVTVDGKMKFACVDGPEFDGHKVDFDELIMRNRTYVDAERISLSLYEQNSACRAKEAAA